MARSFGYHKDNKNGILIKPSTFFNKYLINAYFLAIILLLIRATFHRYAKGPLFQDT